MKADTNADLPKFSIPLKPIEIKMGVAVLATVFLTTSGFLAGQEKIKEALLFFTASSGTAAGIASAVYIGHTLKITSESQQKTERQNESIQQQEKHFQEQTISCLREIIKNQEEKRSIDKINRTLFFISRWNDDYRKKFLLVKIMTEYSQIKDDNDRKKYIREKLKNIRIKTELITNLSYLEEVAFSIREGIVEDALLKDFYLEIVKDYMITFGSWITERRSENKSPQLYIELTKLHDRWTMIR